MIDLDVVVVGAGMAGIYSLYRMRESGLSAVILEAGGGVGGTWYWNRYPGARVDVESIDYSYSFDDELQKSFKWSETFAAQPELRAYFEHVVDRYDLRQHIRLNSRVTAARYDGVTKRWIVTAGDETYSARYVIMATGLLSVPLTPSLPGIEEFKGDVYLTGNWPEQPVDFRRKRVGVFGNGSSGMQVVPTVATTADQVTLFQRTAAYAIPVHNPPMTDADFRAVIETYEDRRKATRMSAVGTSWSAYSTSQTSIFDVSEDERDRIFEHYWQRQTAGFVVAFNDLLTDMEANRIASDWVRDKIRSIVTDPATAEKLVPPDDLPIGCKRLCVENGYFEAFNRPNVSLVDLKAEPIETFLPDGIRTSVGDHKLDMIVLATGFDAFSGALLKMNIEGPRGSLADRWKDGPRNYLGMVMSGFPNMFTVNGPCCTAANFFLATEVQVDWLGRLIETADRQKIEAIEVSEEGEIEWLDHINMVADMVTATNHCQTWFRGTNVPGKPAVVMNYLGGLGAYTDYCEAAEREGYPRLGFRTSAGASV